MDVKDIHRILQQLKIITKYGMTFLCLIMTIHCALLYFGIDSMLIHFSFWAFLMLIGLQLSRIFNLCWVHKASVVYTMSVILCVVLQKNNLFAPIGVDVQVLRAIMFFIGLIMVGLNIWKMTKKSC